MHADDQHGRLFDAVGSLLGLCHHVGYEAQAAIELELACAAAGAGPEYVFDVEGDTIDPGPLLVAMVADARRHVPVAQVAAGFHRAVAAVVVEVAEPLRASARLTTVALSGGVFQNARLVELAWKGLAASGFEVLVPKAMPSNDGGLALGQAFVALARHRRESGAQARQDER